MTYQMTFSQGNSLLSDWIGNDWYTYYPVTYRAPILPLRGKSLGQQEIFFSD